MCIYIYIYILFIYFLFFCICCKIAGNIVSDKKIKKNFPIVKLIAVQIKDEIIPSLYWIH